MNTVTLTNSDASFSSYLSKTEEAFLRSLGESSRKLTNPTTMTSTTQEERNKKNSGRLSKKEQDEEIGVFGAEKYFTGLIDEESPRITSHKIARKYQRTEDEVGIKNPDQIHETRTPSIRSESSSWNSQSALLQSGMKNNINPQIKKKNSKMINKKKYFFPNLGCNYCSCSDENAVDTINELDHDDVGEISFKKSNNKSTAINHRAVEINSKKLDREPCFSFPSSKQGARIKNDEGKLAMRKSVEVFGSPVALEKGHSNRSLSLDKRLSNWDLGTSTQKPKAAADEIELDANSAGIVNIYQDSESDASSDLFEIESLTEKTSNLFLTRLPSDDNTTSGCVTPTTCYAPSEASIEWSVVTASCAADVLSVMSDCELEQRKSSAADNKEIQRSKRPSNILLGCKSHKAVRVAGDAYYKADDDHNNKSSSNNNNNETNFNRHRVVDPLVRRRSDSAIHMARFHADQNNNVTQRVLPAHSLPRLHSPRDSHLLYIQ